MLLSSAIQPGSIEYACVWVINKGCVWVLIACCSSYSNGSVTECEDKIQAASLAGNNPTK